MHAAQGDQPGATIDVSMQEALATLAITELARAGVSGKNWSRRRLTDGNGATVTILPARDGYVAISPREDKQWASWLTAMGSPAWGADPRFITKADRVANWDALHALMSEWSAARQAVIADAAQMRMCRASHCARWRNTWIRHNCGIAAFTGDSNWREKRSERPVHRSGSASRKRAARVERRTDRCL
jgi:crotonobetainyl-CoA:carnitine CoA-transferase CaiB-like acyl-CoA transferase